MHPCQGFYNKSIKACSRHGQANKVRQSIRSPFYQLAASQTRQLIPSLYLQICNRFVFWHQGNHNTQRHQISHSTNTKHNGVASIDLT